MLTSSSGAIDEFIIILHTFIIRTNEKIVEFQMMYQTEILLKKKSEIWTFSLFKIKMYILAVKLIDWNLHPGFIIC